MLLVLISSVAISLQDHNDVWVDGCHQSFARAYFECVDLLSIWFLEDTYNYLVIHLNAQSVWSV